MNIIYIDPLLLSNQSKVYTYYDGLYNSLTKFNHCFIYREKIKDIGEVIDRSKFNPDIILFGLGWNNWNKITGMDKIKILKFAFLFKPQLLLNEKIRFFNENNIDMVLSPVATLNSFKDRIQTRTKRFCYGVDDRVFYPRTKEKIYDVGFSGALHNNSLYVKGSFETYNIRDRAQNMLRDRKNIKSFLNGSDSVSPRIISYKDYAAKISSSKMWMASPAAFGDITPRYFEIPSCKTALLCSKIPSSYGDILKDGVNCIEFEDDLSNLIDKVEFYVKNEDCLNKVVEFSYNDFMANHTWDKRAQEFLNIVGGIKNATK